MGGFKLGEVFQQAFNSACPQTSACAERIDFMKCIVEYKSSDYCNFFGRSSTVHLVHCYIFSRNLNQTLGTKENDEYTARC